MIVTLIGQDQISTLSLPKRVSGQYWLSAQTEMGDSVNVADVEGVQDKWILHGSLALTLLNADGKEIDARILRFLCFCKIFSPFSTKNVCFYVDNVDNPRIFSIFVFFKYLISLVFPGFYTILLTERIVV